MEKTPEILAIEWIKKSHPDMYALMLNRRPGLIQEAYAQPVNGLSGMSGLLDDILGFAKAAIPIYQQQKVFSMQLKQAAAGAQPAPAPVKVVDPEVRTIPDKYGLKVTGTPPKSEFNPWLIGAAVLGVAGLVFVLSRKKRA